MDSERIFLDCIFLAVDFGMLGLFYSIYKNKLESLKALKEAQCVDISNELPKTVEKAGGVIPYAVVSGNVRSLAVPLKSKHFNHLQGVILERITKEHKIRWNSLLHIWTTADNDIKRARSSVPFGLACGTSGLFKRSISVEVIDPLSAHDLQLTTVYDDFKVHESSFGEAIFGFVRGERTVGIAEMENMLLEDTALTAVGKLTIENGRLKISPPEELQYFLSPLSYESLTKKVSASVAGYKVLTLIMCAVSTTLLVFVSRRWFRDIKRRLDARRQKRKLDEERRMRRTADDDNQGEDSGRAPKCVVCLERPVEILILECGHACLCFGCSERINGHCPICRSPVQRLIAAFLP